MRRHGVAPLFLCQQVQREGLCPGTDDASEAAAAFVAVCKARGVPAAHVPTDTFVQWRANIGAHLSAVCAIMGGTLALQTRLSSSRT